MTVDKTAQTGNPEIIRLIKTLGFAGVRAWREYRQMTIKTLAQQAAVSVDMITEIEAGTYPDDPDLLDHLARILANSTKGPIVSRRY